ncbi:MAG: hypothetical protein S0880_36695 [Actinomycetota bacterium]|nr:hypothetical protein [Actinomycetota bacterium]
MATRRITDDQLVDSERAPGDESRSASALVNDAPDHAADRRARAAALGRLLAGWDEAFGRVSATAAADAAALFDDVDAGSVPDAHHRRGD